MAELENYIKNPLFRKENEKLTQQEQLEEYIFLGLRKMDGINVFDIKHKFDIDFDKKYSKIIEKYLSSKHLKKTMNGYQLTLEGVLLSNIIMADFLE